ncbi:uncharacterized protein [Triticum aestivum]|uniref:uncharacterized protein n=1 Tax=Triticum aestivum TaxID=4565 RepID=UPI001D007DEE|nr:uncharacterized protein LOC123136655 [Triticum aestivum]
MSPAQSELLRVKSQPPGAPPHELERLRELRTAASPQRPRHPRCLRCDIARLRRRGARNSRKRVLIAEGGLATSKEMESFTESLWEKSACYHQEKREQSIVYWYRILRSVNSSSILFSKQISWDKFMLSIESYIALRNTTLELTSRMSEHITRFSALHLQLIRYQNERIYYCLYAAT